MTGRRPEASPIWRRSGSARQFLDPAGVDVPDDARRFIKSEVGARAITDLMRWYERQWADSVDFKDDLIELLDASKFGTKEYTPYEVYIKALYEYFKEELGPDAPELGRSAVDLAEFQEDAVKKARRILARYDGVLIADSVGLGKTWIGKKLLEDFAYHRRQKAVVVCPASLREMWQRNWVGHHRGHDRRHGGARPGKLRPPALRRLRRHPDRREPQLRHSSPNTTEILTRLPIVQFVTG